MEILAAKISNTAAPIKNGGLFVYPAATLPEIFDWADANGHQVEWLEAIMLSQKATQPSMEHSTERSFWESEPEFRLACHKLASELAQLAERLGYSPNFEIGIST